VNKKKQILRQVFKEKRRCLSPSDQQKKSQQIVQHIQQSNVFKNAKKIGFYHAVRGEADPAQLAQLKQQGQSKHFYLPVISENQTTALSFVPLTSETKYQNNQYGIPEPIFDNSNLINVKQLDLLIMPLLGFDKRGNRLGMGGGFYDRCLAYKQQSPQQKPLLIGFAYDFQEVDSLQAEKWDIRLDGIATESGLILLD